MKNYRNRLAHSFRTITHEELLDNVMNRLALREVADLLEAVTTVGMTTESFAFGSESEIRRLPRSSARDDLLPGSSLIVLRSERTGELMAARSWRDERDNWRASTRWFRTRAKDDNRLVLGIRDTEMMLTPRVMSLVDNEDEEAYSLLSVPIEPYFWCPKVISQSDSSHVRERRRS